MRHLFIFFCDQLRIEMSLSKSKLSFIAVFFLLALLILQITLIPSQTDTFDFRDGNGPVAAKRHINPDGSIGGWVANTASVSETVILGPHATVFNSAKVSGNVKIFEQAQIFGNASVKDNAWITGTAKVFDNAIISGDAWIGGAAQIGHDQQITTGAYDENGPVEVQRLRTEPAQQAWHYVWVPGPHHNQ